MIVRAGQSRIRLRFAPVALAMTCMLVYACWSREAQCRLHAFLRFLDEQHALQHAAEAVSRLLV